MGFCWDVVAVTAETAGQAHAFQAELQQRRELGSLPGVDTNTILLAVPDPHPTPAAPWETRNTVVGSGGATLNAVLAVAEQLSARQGTGTLDANVLQSRRVCVLHSASTHRVPAASCVGRAFSPLPAALAEDEICPPLSGAAAVPPEVWARSDESTSEAGGARPPPPVEERYPWRAQWSEEHKAYYFWNVEADVDPVWELPPLAEEAPAASRHDDPMA